MYIYFVPYEVLNALHILNLVYNTKCRKEMKMLII